MKYQETPVIENPTPQALRKYQPGQWVKFHQDDQPSRFLGISISGVIHCVHPQQGRVSIKRLQSGARRARRARKTLRLAVGRVRRAIENGVLTTEDLQ